MNLFTDTSELLKGILPIFKAVGYIMGLPIKERKRRKMKLPRYRGFKEDKANLTQDRRSFNQKFRENAEKIIDEALAKHEKAPR